MTVALVWSYANWVGRLLYYEIRPMVYTNDWRHVWSVLVMRNCFLLNFTDRNPEGVLGGTIYTRIERIIFTSLDFISPPQYYVQYKASSPRLLLKAEPRHCIKTQGKPDIVVTPEKSRCLQSDFWTQYMRSITAVNKIVFRFQMANCLLLLLCLSAGAFCTLQPFFRKYDPCGELSSKWIFWVILFFKKR